MAEELLTTQQFGAQIKTKYPQYAKFSDEEIGQKMVQKYPVYQNRIKPVEPTVSPERQADIESARATGALIPANTEKPTALEPAKVLANIPSSAFGFAKGAVQALNPIEILKQGWESGKNLRQAESTLADAQKIAERTAETTNELISTYWQDKQAGKDVSHLEGYFKRNKIDPTKVTKAEPVGNVFSMFAKSLPGAAYETLVPEAGKGLVQAVIGGTKALTSEEFTKEKSAAQKETAEGLQRAHRALVNDPVGSVLPFLIAGRGVAGKIDAVTSKARIAKYVKDIGKPGMIGTELIPKATTPLTTAFETGISKTAAPVIRAGQAVGRGISGVARRGTKFGVSQATGLAPETISQITKTPELFTRESRAAIDRSSLGKEVQSSLSKKAISLKETGEAYKPIRESGASVKIDGNWLDNSITENTGLKIVDGKLQANGSSKLRGSTDVRAMQTLYDLWKPEFQKGTMTADQFLNFRTDLSGLSKFERQIGKSAPVETAAKSIRNKFNTSYRSQIKGLENTDKEFSTQTEQLSRLSKGLIDKNGNLTDSAISKIANATGKEALLARLEETVPGITQKIKVLKAVEDIQNASGIKVGTYGRAAITTGIGVASGIIPGIVTAILTSPEAAVPILRKYGVIKNSNIVKGVLNGLREGGKKVNISPETATRQIMNIGAFSPKK